MDLTFLNKIEANIHFKKYVDFLLSIKIRKPYYLSKENKLELRDLRGVKLKKIFNNIDLTTFDGLRDNAKKNKLWDTFYHITYGVKDDKITPEVFKQETQFMARKFDFNIYQSR